MACDPKKILSDLQVAGVILAYAVIWVSGTMKELSLINTNTDLEIITFRYKNRDFFNVYRFLDGVDQSAEIRAGLYDTDGTEDSFPLIEKISYVQE